MKSACKALLVTVVVIAVPWLSLAHTKNCYTPTDRAAGWKRVVLTPQHENLSAPAGVEQFRNDADATAWQESARVASRTARAGKTEFAFSVGEENKVNGIKLEFSHSLAGARVEIFTDGGDLVVNRRVENNELAAIWDASARSVRVVVHNHLRASPEIVRASYGRVFHAPPSAERALYYRQPPVRAVILCENIATPMAFAENTWLTASVRTIAAIPTLPTKMRALLGM